jgi:hypothetical protein
MEDSFVSFCFSENISTISKTCLRNLNDLPQKFHRMDGMVFSPGLKKAYGEGSKKEIIQKKIFRYYKEE